MMSLGVSKGGVIPPSEEDRKKVIRQMKVRTTLKGDKSWIYPQNSDNEEEMKRSSLHLPGRSGKIDGGSPALASVTPHGNRLPGSKPTSGYLIRGVFTRTIDKTSPESIFYSNGMQKSAAAQDKSASLPRFSSGYKMTTEDYKKLAPFNVRQISVKSDEEKPAFSPDEHKKSDKVDEEKLVETSPAEATTPKPTLATGKSDKPVKEEPGLISWDESVPKATTISTGERSSPQSRDIPAHPTDARFTAPGYLGDAECDPKRSVPGYEEGRPTREIRYDSTRATEHKEPELNVTKSSRSSGDSSAVTQAVRHKVPMHLDDEEFDFNSRSNSNSTESNVTTTDPRHGIPVCMEDGELDPERLSPLKGNTEDAENENISTTQSEPPTTRKHTEPDENTAQLPSASSERISMSTTSFQYHSPSAMGHKSNPGAASKGILFVKEYVNSRELSPTPHYSSDSLIDLSDIERASYLHSSASQRSCEGVCTYCGREIRDCPKIMIEHLNVYCHEYCFRCGICHKAMGDLLDKIFIHRDIVHCDQCYEKLF
ncbi:zinc finger protein 185 isoform X2 [Dermochelys coriacea]|uniref:zinc finger protein 185 isoform X2 n=1 Tax=Dermochelys coriacea TaxID=27794 RepID=UPI001CAA03B3|nr:zinc finger protein 185 isoform X2 [Dermochelys coriacea]